MIWVLAIYSAFITLAFIVAVWENVSLRLELDAHDWGSLL